jgi:hypothetical protein
MPRNGKFARSGGLAGGKARAAALTAAKRKEIAQKAAAAPLGEEGEMSDRLDLKAGCPERQTMLWDTRQRWSDGMDS